MACIYMHSLAKMIPASEVLFPVFVEVNTRQDADLHNPWIAALKSISFRFSLLPE